MMTYSISAIMVLTPIRGTELSLRTIEKFCNFGDPEPFLKFAPDVRSHAVAMEATDFVLLVQWGWWCREKVAGCFANIYNKGSFRVANV